MSQLPGLGTFTTCLVHLSLSFTTCIHFITVTWNFHFHSLLGFVLLPDMSNFHFHLLPGSDFYQCINSMCFTSVYQIFTSVSPLFHKCFKSVSKVLQKCFQSVSKVFPHCLKLFVCIEVIKARATSLYVSLC